MCEEKERIKSTENGMKIWLKGCRGKCSEDRRETENAMPVGRGRVLLCVMCVMCAGGLIQKTWYHTRVTY